MNYTHAFVRPISSQFFNALRRDEPETPINVDLAVQQHNNYVELLKRFIPNVTEIPASDQHPDCNFIEDTAVIVNKKVMINRLGAASRQGEEKEVLEAFKAFPSVQIRQMTAPGLLDGGDVLFTGRHVFVGLSTRTNEEGYNQLKEWFDPVPVISVPLNDIALHLKSVICAYDDKTILVADIQGAENVIKYLQQQFAPGEGYDLPLVKLDGSTTAPANFLRIGKHLIIQKGFPASQELFETLSKRDSLQLHLLDMSELVKADGALTCGSILFNP